MNPRVLIVAILSICTNLLFTEALPRSISNISVIGAVYCDACSNNTFSKHSFFLKGARVLIQCRFRVSSTSTEEISLEAERTTDKYGIYKLDIPPVDGFECREGREIKSACRASLMRSSSSLCNVPGLRGSSQHVAIKAREAHICFFNLNALSYRPAKRDTSLCGTRNGVMSSSSTSGINSSLFFWPFFPPYWFPWPSLPPFSFPPSLPFPFPHIPLPNPSSFPFPIPQWLLPFLKPPYFPFPLYPSPDSQTPSSPPFHGVNPTP
ncbi:uncharacterized protein [Typha angustifolia]|uniref:uncharacterized protein n=1 Tax=Typha angustifolia TaxID=59011 RepID=UPI003C2AAF9C